MKDLKKRIEQREKELKNLPDDEIMRMHESIYSDFQKEPDAALLAAIKREVDRRFQTTSWIWRRKSNPKKYQKWINHKEKMEAIATRFAINQLTKLNDPKYEETINKLKEYLKQL